MPVPFYCRLIGWVGLDADVIRTTDLGNASKAQLKNLVKLVREEFGKFVDLRKANEAALRQCLQKGAKPSTAQSFALCHHTHGINELIEYTANFYDLRMTQNRYKALLPFIPGLEVPYPNCEYQFDF
ncbi:hypothetical protein [Fischerella sp. PCC 9605]|uniref:hypothetical protein n=1 Tax=Fischerella sp. PCC 9605 TaxID=1173024 RepID=UPI0004B79076|nr:hypothetical protein [Fischerella sp. PCC 9605]